MIRTSLRRLSASDIHSFARRGEAFEAASMNGVNGRTGTGRMSRELQEQYRAADVLYTVLSYGTPIAWLTAAGWVVSETKYSVTTSRHQNIARQLFPRA